MLSKKFVTDVIIQGDYMSGDRNTIASALRVNSKLGVLIVAAVGFDQTGNELKTFYEKASSSDRVELYVAPLPTPLPPTPEKRKELAEETVNRIYKQTDKWCRGRGPNARGVTRRNPDPTPQWVRSCVEPGVRVHPATFGTREIAQNFKADPTEARKKIREYWRLPGDALGTGLYAAVGNYLTSKGFRADRRYVFLFAKEGDRHAEKAHHFTSILTWRILQERIERETNIIPVAVGDDIGLRTSPRMVKFWNDTEWKKIFESSSLDPRSAQLGMWCYLAEKYSGVSIIGMRSGMIEVPALLGIHTLYLEEKHNEQASRMAQWLGGVVPTYDRQVVDLPPGIKQQAYWNNASLQAKRTSDVYKHAAAQGGHVRNLVMGFESKKGDTQYKGKQYDDEKPLVGRSLAAKQPRTLDVKATPSGKTWAGVPQAQAVAKAVFGRGGLAKIVPAEKLMLDTAEFQAIIDWVEDKTPKPTGVVDAVHGYIPGHLEKKGEALNDQSAAKAIKNWSKYFSSPEYIQKIGADKPLNLTD